jgi:hypothetical protein
MEATTAPVGHAAPTGTQPSTPALPAPRNPAGTATADRQDADISYASLYTVQAASRSGGLHRGNLAVLIRYWTVGEGRAKIGWGTGGDFNRCVRRLSKYVPPGQVKGFCARLHKKATGKWPGPGRGH